MVQVVLRVFFIVAIATTAFGQSAILRFRTVESGADTSRVIGFISNHIDSIGAGYSFLIKDMDCRIITVKKVISFNPSSRIFDAVIQDSLDGTFYGLAYKGSYNPLPETLPNNVISCVSGSNIGSSRLSLRKVGTINLNKGIGTSQSLVFYRHYLYGTMDGNDTLYIFDFSDYEHPVLVNKILRDTNLRTNLNIYANLLVSTTETWDLSDPENPKRVCHIPSGFNIQGNPLFPAPMFASYGPYMYGVDNLSRMIRFNPQTCYWDTVWLADDWNYWQEDEIEIEGSILFTSLNDNNCCGDEVMAWTINPDGSLDSLTAINIRPGGAWPNNNIGAIEDGWMYYSFDSYNGPADSIYIVDISNIFNPKVVAQVKSYGDFYWNTMNTTDLEVIGNTMIEASSNGLALWDVSDKSNPFIYEVHYSDHPYIFTVNDGFLFAVGMKDTSLVDIYALNVNKGTQVNLDRASIDEIRSDVLQAHNINTVSINSASIGSNYIQSRGLKIFENLVIPQMTQLERDAFTGFEKWSMIICTDCLATDGSTGVLQVWTGTTWKNAW